MNQKDFGLRLKELRQSHNLTQSQLALRLKLSRQAYSNYEQGRACPSPETLAKLSIFLDTNLFEPYMLSNSNQITAPKKTFINRIDQEEFISFLNLYSQLSVYSRTKVLNLMKLMPRGGDV